jgi:hypothetical protein
MKVFVHGLFGDEANAARAIDFLIEAHFETEDISALMRAGDHMVENAPGSGPQLVRGAALGATLGAIGGALVTISGFLAAGPLLGIVGGAAIGGLEGVLGSLGYSSNEVDFHEHVPGGMILIGVSTDEGSIERARAALAQAGPNRIHVSRKSEACEEVETGVLSKTGILPGA